MAGDVLKQQFGVTEVMAFVNPEAPNAPTITHQLHAVEERFGTVVTTFESEPRTADTLEKFLETHAGNISKKTLMIVKGGDGMAHLWDEILQHPDTPDAAKDVNTLFDGDGTKCDTANSLNLRELLRNPARLLADRRAHIDTIRPFEFMFQTPDGDEGTRTATRNVLSYAGVGADGIGAACIELAKPGFRDLIAKYGRLGRLAQRCLEPAVVLQASWASPTFTLHELDDPQHPMTSENVLQWLVRNGPRMAGYQTSYIPLTRPEVAISTTQTTAQDKRRTGTVLGNGLRLATRTLPAETHNLERRERHWELTDIQEGVLYGEADGEPFAVAAGHIAIKPARPLRVITTQPHSHRGL